MQNIFTNIKCGEIILYNANENWYIILYDLFSRLCYIATCGPFCKDIGYEPADLTVHPPELPRVGSFFSYRCLVFPKKMSSKESLNISELFRFKDPKTCFFSIFTQTKFG